MSRPVDQIQSVLFGLALGDALGYPVEFLGRDALRQQYGSSGIQAPPNPALYSDDTQMTLALAEGVLDAGVNAPIDDLMDAIGQRFVQWMHSPENKRAPGLTCINGLKRYEAGASWREAGIVASKGCGSAMRVAVLGYLYQSEEKRLYDVAYASSLITHRHPTAVAASVAAAYLVKLALDSTPIPEYMPKVYAFTTGISDEMDLAILRVGHVLGWVNEDQSLDHIGQGWTGEEAVALALYCVLRYPDDYVACMRRAANTPGDSDSIACIAGGIMGARLGLEAIPADWRDRCENAEMFTDLAHRLATAKIAQGS
ncbi:MAG: ADP-ribosylglycohydrolase family protein [Chloroflexi bacterium]|nr:ADP-ribosylglycohydrolase family protein [Chloroflexota bacterium]